MNCRVIDFHTHNFPDAIAERAIAGMVEKLNREYIPVGDGTLSCQLAAARADGIDRCVMCPIATKPSQADVILRTAVAIRDGGFGEEAARTIIPLASVHPLDPDMRAHVRNIAEAGIAGVKFHPYYQDFSLADPAVWPMFEAVRDAGLCVIVHCGKDLGFRDAPMYCGPREIRALLDAVPGLGPRFVAAHLGGRSGNPPRSVDLLLDTGCCIDTACLSKERSDPEAVRIMDEWPADRMVFGTDYPWSGQRELVEWVSGHRKDAAERELVFHANAERVLGMED